MPYSLTWNLKNCQIQLIQQEKTMFSQVQMLGNSDELRGYGSNFEMWETILLGLIWQEISQRGWVKRNPSPDGLTDRQGSLAVLNTSILGLTVLNRKVFTIFWGTTITHKPDSSCEPSMGLRHREWCTQ